jgi:hypothetical protein
MQSPALTSSAWVRSEKGQLTGVAGLPSWGHPFPRSQAELRKEVVRPPRSDSCPRELP